jgi:hypothetical protein
MTSPRLWQTEFGKRRIPVVATAIMAACVLPVVAACSAGPGQVDLPGKPAAVTPVAVTPVALSAPVRATPREQVIAALTGYTAALGKAEQSRSDRAARQLLRPYLTAGRIGGVVEAISAIWARGDRFYGVDVLHIISVRIDGRRAFVHDCDDTSGMGLENAATGEAVPGSAGVPQANLVTRLDRVAGHWIVKFQLPEDVPCAP